jgi:CRP/FNR family transcriptional regulator, anaerobic regulatory protein
MSFEEPEPFSDDERGVHTVLSQYDIYANGSDEFRQVLRSAADYLKIERGKTVMHSGEICDVVLFVGNGRVRVFVEGETGRVANLYHVQPGECCPINIGACLMAVEAWASAAADSDVEAAVIPTERFHALRDGHGELRDWLFDQTAVRYGEIVSLLRNVITLTVDQRIAEYLLSQSPDFRDDADTINITHANFAMEIGTAREVVNRRLKSLEKAGIVSLSRGEIAIVNRPALESIRDGGG